MVGLTGLGAGVAPGPAAGAGRAAPPLCNIRYKIRIYGNLAMVSTVFPDFPPRRGGREFPGVGRAAA